MIKKPKKNKPVSSEQILESLFLHSKSPFSDQFQRWRLWQKWPEVVGKSIARDSEPVGYHNGVLYLWVKNSVIMNQMIFLAGKIKDKVNEKLGSRWVKSVRFTLDRKAVPKREETDEGFRDFLSK